MPLSHVHVRDLARLARLELTPEQIETLTVELASVMAYVDQLKAVGTHEVDLSARTAGNGVSGRPDRVAESLPEEAALGNAPRSDGEFFIVPRVIG